MDALGRTIEVSDLVYVRTTDTFMDLDKHLANEKVYGYLLRGRINPVPILENLGHSIRLPWRSGYRDYNTHQIVKDDGIVYDSEFEPIRVGAYVVFSNAYADYKSCNLMTGVVEEMRGTAVRLSVESRKSFPKMRVCPWQPSTLVKVIG